MSIWGTDLVSAFKNFMDHIRPNEEGGSTAQRASHVAQGVIETTHVGTKGAGLASIEDPERRFAMAKRMAEAGRDIDMRVRDLGLTEDQRFELAMVRAQNLSGHHTIAIMFYELPDDKKIEVACALRDNENSNFLINLRAFGFDDATQTALANSMPDDA